MQQKTKKARKQKNQKGVSAKSILVLLNATSTKDSICIDCQILELLTALVCVCVSISKVPFRESIPNVPYKGKMQR